MNSLNIGASNTLEVCKNFILEALPNLRAGMKSFLYQRVAMQNSQMNSSYQYYEFLSLLTALYLQSEADKKSKSCKGVILKRSATIQGARPNLYLDFVNQPDIQKYTRSKHREYLVQLSKALTDPEIITHGCSMASRNIKISASTRKNVSCE